MKKLFIFLIVISIGVFCAVKFKNDIAVTLTRHFILTQTGYHTQIEHIDVVLKDCAIAVENVRVFTGKGENKSQLAEIPLLLVDFDRDKLFKRKIRLDRISLHIASIDVRVNRDAKPQNTASAVSLKGKDADHLTSLINKIDYPIYAAMVEFKIDNVVKNYFKQNHFVEKKIIPVNIRAKFSNVSNLQAIITSIRNQVDFYRRPD